MRHSYQLMAQDVVGVSVGGGASDTIYHHLHMVPWPFVAVRKKLAGWLKAAAVSCLSQRTVRCLVRCVPPLPALCGRRLAGKSASLGAAGGSHDSSLGGGAGWHLPTTQHGRAT